MGVPIGLCNKCKEYTGTNTFVCCDLFLDKKKTKFSNTKEDSIVLPYNQINLYNESKLNLNNLEDYFYSTSSPISKVKQNNIYLSQMNGNDLINNIKNNSNNDINKVYEILKYQNENKTIKEESYNKEQSQVKEENNFNPKFNNLEELINKFDEQIKEFAEYISEEQFNEAENKIIKEIENNLEKFENNFKNNSNSFERPPLLFKKDNSLYKGFWNSKGEKNGFGIFLDSQGNKYIGQWENDKFNGKGRILSVNGDYYEGDFNKGLIEGTGTFYSKKESYEYYGNFKKNKFHGEGKITYEKSNITYEGEFQNGYKKGFGTMIFADNSYYEGYFENNNFNGKGKFFFNDGRSYTGDWKKNAIDGKGIFTWEKSESKYSGYYKNNMREGNGVYSFGCNLYDGNWVNGMPHGEGTLLYEGLKIVGHFRYGKILGMVDGKGANRLLTEQLTLDSRVNLKYELTFKETMDSKISRKINETQKTFGSKKDVMSRESRENNFTKSNKNFH